MAGEEFNILDISNRFNQVAGGSWGEGAVQVDKRIFEITGGEFNILDLFRKVFGYRGIPYGVFKTDHKTNKADAFADNVIMLMSDKTADVTSALGTPIFQPFQFTWYDDEGIAHSRYLPNEPLVTITGKKHIIRTPLAGISKTNYRRGTVKELIGMDDYQLKIQGFAINMTEDAAPEEDIRLIRTICELNKSIDVMNPLLSFFDIKKLAIEDMKFPAVEGYLAVQGYEITGYSDEDYLLELALNS